MAPIIMCLYFALMYKTLGGYRWSDILYKSQRICENNTVTEHISRESLVIESVMDSDADANIFKTAQLSLHELKSVTPLLFGFVWLKHFFYYFRFSQQMYIVVYSDLLLGGVALSGSQHRLLAWYINRTSQKYK